jgi:hypothetical protein
MARSRGNARSRRASGEVGRYRQAAEEALAQLDWTINYLQRIQKADISRALAKNRSLIRQRLKDRR